MVTAVGEAPAADALGAAGAPETPPMRPVRRWPRRMLIVTNIFVPLSLVSFGAVYAYVRYRVSHLRTISLPGLTTGAGGAPRTRLAGFE